MEYNDFEFITNSLTVEKMNQEYLHNSKENLFNGYDDIKSYVCTLSNLEIKAKMQHIENCIQTSNDYLEFYRLKNYRKHNFDIPKVIEQNHRHQDFLCDDDCDCKPKRCPKPCPCSPKDFIGNELCVLYDLLNLFCLPNCNLNRNCLKDIIVIRFDNLKNFIG